jgi:LysM repeat protein
MNMQSSPPPSQRFVEAKNPMKAFVLLVLMILLFVFLSATNVARTNLTPETQAAAVQNFAPAEPQVITIQGSTPGLAEVPDTVFVPVTGDCTDPYIVQQGDYLSRIASICGTTVGAIRLANPQIVNINLIYPGMSIRIPGGAVGQPVQPQQPLPVTGEKDPLFQWTATPVIQAPTPAVATVTPEVQMEVEPEVGAPVFRTGTEMVVRALSLPPNTPVSIAIGPVGGPYEVVAGGVTDQQGDLSMYVTVPPAPNEILPHVVVVTTTTVPAAQTISTPFYISADE